MDRRAEKPLSQMSNLEAGMIFIAGAAVLGLVYALEAILNPKDLLVTAVEATTKGVARLWRNVPNSYLIKK